ncbi:MAG TPA: hypothetical protein VD713_00420 [Sphingomonadales bacterium]|nr:hypothetical protein [Sphingomonadales bacterium]
MKRCCSSKQEPSPERLHLQTGEAALYTRALLPIIHTELRAAGKPGILKVDSNP